MKTGLEQVHLQGIHTNGQEVQEEILNTSDH